MANIAAHLLADQRNVLMIVDGLRTEHGRSHKDQSPLIKVHGETPDWMKLARDLLQRAPSPITDGAFADLWAASTIRAQGCEVLSWLSRASDSEKHDRIVRDEIFCGVDGGFYNRTAVSEYELAMHFLLTRADDVVIIEHQGATREYMYWSQGRWIEESDRGSSLLAADVMDAAHHLLNELHNHHARSLKRA